MTMRFMVSVGGCGGMLKSSISSSFLGGARSCGGGGGSLVGQCRLMMSGGTTGVEEHLFLLRGDRNISRRRRTLGVTTSSRSVFGPSMSMPMMMQERANSSVAAGVNPKKWDIFTGIVLERRPIISQEMTAIEKEFAEMMAKIEAERSKKSNHEVKKEKDAILLEKLKSGQIEADQVSAQTAQDLEDLWSAEAKKFVPASRLTDADRKNDLKSLQRALDSHLLLVVEQKLGQEWKWICPHGKWEEGETLRQTAERTIKKLCPDVKARVLGNAPWGVYKYKYPQKTRESLRSSGSLSNDVIGAKVFFYKAQVASGGTLKNTSSQEVKDFVWLKRNELETKLHPEYFKQLAEVLIDEHN